MFLTASPVLYVQARRPVDGLVGECHLLEPQHRIGAAIVTTDVASWKQSSSFRTRRLGAATSSVLSSARKSLSSSSVSERITSCGSP